MTPEVTVAREIDADDVSAADGDAVPGIESEVAVTDPQSLDDRLSDQPVSTQHAVLGKIGNQMIRNPNSKSFFFGIAISISSQSSRDFGDFELQKT